MPPDDAIWLPLCAAIVGLAALTPAMRRAYQRLRAALPREERPPTPCPTCGYDVRATLFQCPECGTKLLWGELPGDRNDYAATMARRNKQRERSYMRAGC